MNNLPLVPRSTSKIANRRLPLNGSDPLLGGIPVRKLNYGIDKVDFIRDKLAGYGGGVTIASELIQNADDAGAITVRFFFSPGQLLLYNDSEFRDEDFKAISSIASGSKRADEGKIGTWGTGFLSVYHLTDTPKLHSASQFVTFDPTKSELDVLNSPFQEGTRFILPWRRQPTTLSKHIEANTWNEKAIQELQASVITAIYAHILFLRSVRIIEIYDGEEGESARLLSRVERTRQLTTPIGHNMRREQSEITYKRAGQQERVDTWLYYRMALSHSVEFADVKAKDYEISLAFPLDNRPWLDENVPGTLYNFLPTPIRTGFGFQINGAFFPDNNRKQILLDDATQRAKARWNQQILTSLGQLFVDVLLDIRDRCPTPKRFYDLFPLQSPLADYLAVFRDKFVSDAAQKEIVFTSRESWKQPTKVFQGLPASSLPELAAPYLDVLPTGIPQVVRDYLQNRCKNLNWQAIRDFLRPHLVSGIRLADAHEMINSRDKLSVLYKELPNTTRTPETHEHGQLRSLPLCLDAEGKLQPFDGHIWRVDKKNRDLLSGLRIPFVDAQMETDHPRLIESLVDEFRGADLVEWLAEYPWPDTPFAISDAPKNLIPNPRRLQRYIYFIEDDLENVDTDQLRLIPLLRGEDEHLYRGVETIFRLDDGASRDALRHFGLRFVHPEWSDDSKIAGVYARASVALLKPADVVTRLDRTRNGWAVDLSAEEKLQRLLKLYEYFHFHRADLPENERHRLRHLPICLTQQASLVAVEENGRSKIFLPPKNALQDDVLTVLDNLGLTNLVHGYLLQNGRPFLTEVLGVEELTPLALIKDVIVLHYADPRLNHPQRKTLLDYIRTQTRGLNEEEQTVKELRKSLNAAPLIRNQSDEYVRASALYFSSPALDAIFAESYQHLHPSYGIPKGSDEGPDKPYKQHEWYAFLRRLGVNEDPTAADLVAAVKRITVSGPPVEARLDTIRRIYQLLRSEVGPGRRFNPEGLELSALREIAWLPAAGDERKWYRPRDLYPANVRELIGEQGHLLSLEQPSTALGDLLRIPTMPPADLVIKHLIASAESQKEVSLRIYTFLAREVDENQLRQLAQRQCVLDNNRQRYWYPRHIFFGDHKSLFGERRGYLKPPGGEAQEFLERLGMRAQPDDDDSISLIDEIAQEFVDASPKNAPISDEDRRLLLLHYHRLGERSQSEYVIRQHFANQPVVLGTDGFLHRANRIVYADQPDLLQHFSQDAVPCVESKELSETGYRFLQQLGVRKLSQLVQRKPVNVIGAEENIALAYRIKHLANSFDRLALTLREEDEFLDLNDPSKTLQDIEIQICRQMSIDYSLADDGGWFIGGNRQPDQAALYDTSANILYAKQDELGDFSNLTLAKELEYVLFSGHKQSPVIEQILSMNPAEVQGYLDRHGYRPLLEGKVEYSSQESDNTNLADWGDITSDNDWNQQDDEADEAYVEPQEYRAEIEEDMPTQASLFGTQTNQQQEDQTNGQRSIDQRPRNPIPPALPILSPDSPRTNDGDKSWEQSKKLTQSENPNPIFTGQIRPTVPVLPNNYGELQEKYGLQRFGDSSQQVEEIINSESVEGDSEWGKEFEDQNAPATNGKRRTTVRFTLTFQNRYEGFLPLHRTAREMLFERPTQLTCQTDDPDWSFHLYADYDSGILYNQKELPRYWEARGIPAGGIVYLELVHGNTVRLYWKKTEHQIQKVRCLELLEDGTLDEFEIDAVDIPCEVSEYVFRAEKRLEDEDALFKQALGKRGLFQTICEVFGSPDQELSFDQIFHKVQSIRQVATASIDYLLQERPCFVALPDGHWRFEPERGSKPIRRPVTAPKTSQPESSTKHTTLYGTPATGVQTSEVTAKPAETSPEATIFMLAQSEWTRIGKLFTNQTKPVDQLQRLLAEVNTLFQRLKSDVAALTTKVEVADSVVDDLWRRISQSPDDQSGFDLLEKHFRQTLDRERPLPIGKIRQCLAVTEGWQREQIFFPLLAKMAKLASTRNLADASIQIYQLLQEQQAGDFSQELAKFEADENVDTYIKLISELSDESEKWQLRSEAWREYPGNAMLRKEICSSVLESFHDCLDAVSAQPKPIAQVRLINQWLDRTYPVFDAWVAISRTNNLWPQLVTLVKISSEERSPDSGDRAKQILMLVSRLPEENLNQLPLRRVLETYRSQSDRLENAGDTFSAIVLLEYALQLTEIAKALLNVHLQISVHIQLADWYELMERPDRAYKHLNKAHKLSESGEDKVKIGNRLHHLRPFREFVDSAKAAQWNQKTKQLLESSDYGMLVNHALFRRLVVDRIS